MSEAEKIYRVGGYVKRAKLNMRNADEIKAFHRRFYVDKFADYEDCILEDVYIGSTEKLLSW